MTTLRNCVTYQVFLTILALILVLVLVLLIRTLLVLIPSALALICVLLVLTLALLVLIPKSLLQLLSSPSIVAHFHLGHLHLLQLTASDNR